MEMAFGRDVRVFSLLWPNLPGTFVRALRRGFLNPLCAGIWSTPNVSKPSPDVLWTDTSHCHVGSQSRMRAYLAHDG